MPLRLGLLQCDSLDPPHVDLEGDYDRLFAELLAGPAVELVVYRADHGQLPRTVSECDAWLVPGSRQSVYDDLAWIADLRRFVGRALAAEHPLIGVCFGHQMIAAELGAEVAKADTGWGIGAVEYRLTAPPPTAAPDGRLDRDDPSFTLIASHQDQVLTLPEGAELLASNDRCPIAGFRHGRAVLTVQGHPEFSATVAESLYRSRVERIGAGPIEAALATLDRPLDRAWVADWVVATAGIEPGDRA